MAMSRKDFVALATTLNNALRQAPDRRAAEITRTTIRDIADYCATSNSNFNRSTFFTACGLTADGELPSDDAEALRVALEGAFGP
jgi:hypothetical protein